MWLIVCIVWITKMGAFQTQHWELGEGLERGWGGEHNSEADDLHRDTERGEDQILAEAKQWVCEECALPGHNHGECEQPSSHRPELLPWQCELSKPSKN